MIRVMRRTKRSRTSLRRIPRMRKPRSRASRRVRYGTDDAYQNEIVFSTTAVYASYSRRTHPSRHGSSWLFVRKATRDDDTHSMCQTLLSSPTSSLATNAAPDPAPCFHDNRKSYRRWFSCLRFNSSRPCRTFPSAALMEGCT